MERIQVQSSKILTVAYNNEKSLLEVIYKNGQVYLYREVPPNFWLEMMLASSIGKYYFDNIHGVFPYKQGYIQLEKEEE